MAGRGRGGIGSIGRALLARGGARAGGPDGPGGTGQAAPWRRAAQVRSNALPPVNTEGGCEFIAEPGDRRLHAALPGRLLHGRRPDQPHRPARALQRRRDARERRTANTSKPPPTTPSDGFSPGSVILAEGPGHRHGRRRAREQGACRSTTSASTTRANAPVVVIDAQTGEALADLGRDRLDRRQTRRTPCCEIHPAVNFTSGRPLHRRPAQPQERGPRIARSARRLPLLPRQRRQRTGSRQRPPAATSKNCSRRSKQRASSARACTWRGTSRSPATPTTPNASSTCATTPSPSSATPTSPTASPRASRPASTSRKSKTNPTPGEIARRVKGTFEVPCFLFPTCETGRADACSTAKAHPIQNGTWTANFDCIIPVSVTTGAAEQGRPSLYGHGLLGSADEVASGPQRSLSENYKIVHCATDEIGMAESDVPTVIAALAEPVGVPGDPRPPPAGPARRALPRARDDQPERLHDRRRLPPGRHARQRLGAEHRATSTTTATARAGSWEAR